MQIFVQYRFVDITIALDVEPSDKVIDVKVKIEEKLKDPGSMTQLFETSVMRQYSLCYSDNPNKTIFSPIYEVLDDDKLLTFYNVSKDSTLDLSKSFGKARSVEKRAVMTKERQYWEGVRNKWLDPVKNKAEVAAKRATIDVEDDEEENGGTIAIAKPGLSMANKNQIIKNISTIQKKVKDDDACQNFKEKLFRSRSIEMNKEVELKAKTFMKLEQQKVELEKKITELENKKGTNITEYEDRNGQAEQEIKNIDQDIEKAKITLQKCQDDLANKKKMRYNATERKFLDTSQTDSTNNKIKQEIGSLKRKINEIEKEQGDLPKKQKVNEGLVEFISNKIEGKQKDLECPVCFETAETHIYQCTEGHLICKKCLPSLKLCPECRTKYPKKTFRNRFAEKMAEELKMLLTERKSLLDGI